MHLLFSVLMLRKGRGRKCRLVKSSSASDSKWKWQYKRKQEKEGGATGVEIGNQNIKAWLTV